MQTCHLQKHFAVFLFNEMLVLLRCKADCGGGLDHGEDLHFHHLEHPPHILSAPLLLQYGHWFMQISDDVGDGSFVIQILDGSADVILFDLDTYKVRSL